METRDTCNVHIPFESGQVLRIYADVVKLAKAFGLDPKDFGGSNPLIRTTRGFCVP